MKIPKDTAENIKRELSKTFLKDIPLEELWKIYKKEVKPSDISLIYKPEGLEEDLFHHLIEWAYSPYGFNLNRCFKESYKNTGADLNWDILKKTRGVFENMTALKQLKIANVLKSINENIKTNQEYIAKLKQLKNATLYDKLSKEEASNKGDINDQ